MMQGAQESSTLPSRYDRGAMLLHWLIAAMVLINIGLGLYFVDLPQDFPNKSLFTQTHKSIGLTVLMLSILRLGWRFTHPVPALPPNMSGLLRLVSRLVHWLFYFLLIAIPLAGWCIVSVSPLGITTVYFGLFKWPHIWFLTGWSMADRQEYVSYFVATHNTLAFTALALIVLHVAAALYHHYIVRDNVLVRMLPEKTPPAS